MRHLQNGDFKLLIPDYRGSTLRVYKDNFSWPNWTSSWQLVDSYDYDVFGAINSHSPNSGSLTPSQQGKLEMDGLYDFGARDYASDGITKRWNSPDPVMRLNHDPQSLNRYTYVRNDPVNLVDPDGRRAFLQ
jgi:RHS repeat-associated protein